MSLSIQTVLISLTYQIKAIRNIIQGTVMQIVSIVFINIQCVFKAMATKDPQRKFLVKKFRPSVVLVQTKVVKLIWV